MKVVQKLQEEVIGHLDLDGYVLCEPQEPIVEVLKKMRHQHVSAVLVEEDGRLVGIFNRARCAHQGGRPAGDVDAAGGRVDDPRSA